MSVQAIALLISIITTAFTVGIWFGVLRGKFDRHREHLRDHGKRIAQLEEKTHRAQIRARDIELALGAIAKRPYYPRFPEDWPDPAERTTYAPEPPHPGQYPEKKP